MEQRGSSRLRSSDMPATYLGGSSFNADIPRPWYSTPATIHQSYSPRLSSSDSQYQRFIHDEHDTANFQYMRSPTRHIQPYRSNQPSNGSFEQYAAHQAQNVVGSAGTAQWVDNIPTPPAPTQHPFCPSGTFPLPPLQNSCLTPNRYGTSHQLMEFGSSDQFSFSNLSHTGPTNVWSQSANPGLTAQANLNLRGFNQPVHQPHPPEVHDGLLPVYQQSNGSMPMPASRNLQNPARPRTPSQPLVPSTSRPYQVLQRQESVSTASTPVRGQHPNIISSQKPVRDILKLDSANQDRGRRRGLLTSFPPCGRYRGVFKTWSGTEGAFEHLRKPFWKPETSPEDDETFPQSEEDKAAWAEILFNAIVNLDDYKDLIDSKQVLRWKSNRYAQTDIEARAWQVVQFTVELHQDGSFEDPRHDDSANKKSNCRKLRFAERMQEVCRALKNWKCVCCDVMDGMKTRLLVSNPVFYALAKARNQMNNEVKRQRNIRAKERAEQDMTIPNTGIRMGPRQARFTTQPSQALPSGTGRRSRRTAGNKRTFGELEETEQDGNMERTATLELEPKPKRARKRT